MESQFNPFSLKGKTILVTGASSGIGRQCAIDCSRMGAKVVAVARNQERLDETLSLLEGAGHNSYLYDLGYTEGIGELVQEMVSECGKFDGMVYAAGIEKTLPSKLLKPSDYEEVFRINTLSAFEMTRNVCRVKNINKSLGG